MKKIDFNKKLSGLKSPKFLLNGFLIVIFAVIFTGIIVSKYFFFQTIAGTDNISKVMVVAPRDIEVVDNIKTEKRKREVAHKVSLVYAPADDGYIKNNLNEIINEIQNIRNSGESEQKKQKDMDVMLDISDISAKSFIVSYFLNADDELLNKIFVSSQKTLTSVLNEGITEKDFEENSLSKIIRRNIEANTTNNQIKVITALLEQVIVPNMIVDEEATAIARKNARDMVSPIIVKFNKGDTIVKVWKSDFPRHIFHKFFYFWTVFPGIHIKHFDFSLFCLQKAHNVSNSCCFPTAVCADKTEDFPFMDVESDIKNASSHAIIFCEVFNINDNFFFHSTPPNFLSS